MSPLRTEEHQTGRRAENIFEAAIPSEWVVNKTQEDYGIDYYVEVFDGIPSASATGLFIGVQLKGTKTPTAIAETIGYRLSVEHLKYYVDRVRYPMFLVVVDISKGLGYWCDLKKYAVDTLACKGWRSQKTVSIRIPVEHRMDDRQKLRKAIEAAYHRMSELQPGAITGALRAEEVRLAEKDDRITDVRISASSSGKVVKFTPKDGFEFTVQATGNVNDVRRLMSDLIDRGIDVEAEEYEVQMQALDPPGSPGITQPIKAMSFRRSVSGSVRILSVDRMGSEHASIEQHGQFVGGKRELRFISAYHHDVVSVSAVVAGEGGTPERAKLTWGFDLSPWLQQPLLSLNGFARFAQFVGQSNAEDKVRFELLIGETVIGPFDASSEADSVLERWKAIVEFLTLARDIARQVKPDLLLLDRDSPASFADLEYCSKFLNGESVPVPLGSLTLNMEVTRESGVSVGQRLAEVSVRLPHQSFPVSVLGQEVDLGPVEYCSDDLEIEVLSVSEDPTKDDTYLVSGKSVNEAKWNAKRSSFSKI